MTPIFSLIIPSVHHNHLVRACIESIQKHETHHSYEIIVVDDGSMLETQESLEKICLRLGVKCVLREENGGFSQAVNTGLQIAQGKYILLVNNDILFTRPILRTIQERFEKLPNVGIIGGKLKYPDGRIQHAGMTHLKGHHFVHLTSDVETPKYVPSVTGALYAISRECFLSVGFFDTSYFLSCEDTEYSLRAWQKGFHVFYEPEMEAIHHEGATRGRLLHEKLKISPEWVDKESRSVLTFKKRMAMHPVETALIANLNQSLDASRVKLEVGCGMNPQPGYMTLDVIKAPHINYVCDFSKEPLPFHNDHIDEILSNHSIEHVSWRVLPFVLGEWFRVLKPGGKVFLRTPDLEFICRLYLSRKTTPEAKQDENYIHQYLSDEITPAWWANIKLFAGQDYPSNFHYLCFDFEMLKALLERMGFEKVTRVSVKPVFSPGELQVEAYKPKSHSPHKPTKKILVKRSGAMGDVIMATPVIGLLEKCYPQAEVHVETECPKALPQGFTVVQSPNHADYDKVFDLDLVYERSPSKHAIDAYMQHVFPGMLIEDEMKATRFIPEFTKPLDLPHEKTVVIHPAKSWENRTIPKATWDTVIKSLLAADINIVVVGQGDDFCLLPPGSYSLYGNSLSAVANAIWDADLFIGPDSGILHIAGTTTTPILGLFTCVKAEYRMPFRNQELNHVMKPDLDCYGCLERKPAPVTHIGCERGDNACVNFSAQAIVDRAISILNA